MTDAHNAAGVGVSCATVDTVNTSTSTQRGPQKISSPLSETLLETSIEVAKQRLCEAPTRREKLDAWREMCRLIDQRTPARVRFMERMRDIA